MKFGFLWRCPNLIRRLELGFRKSGHQYVFIRMRHRSIAKLRKRLLIQKTWWNLIFGPKLYIQMTRYHNIQENVIRYMIKPQPCPLRCGIQCKDDRFNVLTEQFIAHGTSWANSIKAVRLNTRWAAEPPFNRWKAHKSINLHTEVVIGLHTWIEDIEGR